MKFYLVLFCFILAFHSKTSAQNGNQDYYIPTYAIKTNLLYWATTTPNLGLEFGLNRNMTLDITGNYNPFILGKNRKLKHILVQPEFRYWLCERFNGHFFGVNAIYSLYNVGGIKALNLDGHRYEGHLFGAGFSYGYQWVISNRWNLEATLGLGYARLIYDKYNCETCKAFQGREHKNYFGPVKAGVSFIYFIK